MHILHLAEHADQASKKQHADSTHQTGARAKGTRSTVSAHEIWQNGDRYILVRATCSCMRPRWFLLLLRIFHDHTCVYSAHVYISCWYMHAFEWLWKWFPNSNNLEVVKSVAWADLQYGPPAGCKILSFHKFLIFDLPELAHQLVSISDRYSCVLHLLALDFLSTRSNTDPTSAPPNLLVHAFLQPPSLKHSRLSLPPFQRKRDL